MPQKRKTIAGTVGEPEGGNARLISVGNREFWGVPKRKKNQGRKGGGGSAEKFSLREKVEQGGTVSVGGGKRNGLKRFLRSDTCPMLEISLRTFSCCGGEKGQGGLAVKGPISGTAGGVNILL